MSGGIGTETDHSNGERFSPGKVDEQIKSAKIRIGFWGIVEGVRRGSVETIKLGWEQLRLGLRRKPL